MELALLHFFGGFGLLYLGGEALVRGSVRLATRVGITPLVAGLTIVAFGTSAPELAVSLDAALEGYDDVAIGGVVGSNICNIGLILGVAALIRPIRVDIGLIRVELPVLLGSAALLALSLLDDRLGRLEGFPFLLGALAYTGVTVWTALQRRDRGEVSPDDPDGAPHPHAALVVLMVIFGLIAIAGGGYLLVHGGVAIAEALGVSNAVIALTMVAIGTSLPELATSLIASARGHSEIALGNVVGTNIYNVLAILGVTSTIRPLARGGVGWSDIVLMLGFTLLVAVLSSTGSGLRRWKGALLLLGYAGYTASRFANF